MTNTTAGGTSQLHDKGEAMVTASTCSSQSLTLTTGDRFIICQQDGDRVVVIVGGKRQTAREIFSSPNNSLTQEKLGKAAAAVRAEWKYPLQHTTINDFIAQL